MIPFVGRRATGRLAASVRNQKNPRWRTHTAPMLSTDEHERIGASRAPRMRGTTDLECSPSRHRERPPRRRCLSPRPWRERRRAATPIHIDHVDVFVSACGWSASTLHVVVRRLSTSPQVTRIVQSDAASARHADVVQVTDAVLGRGTVRGGCALPGTPRGISAIARIGCGPRCSERTTASCRPRALCLAWRPRAL